MFAKLRITLDELLGEFESLNENKLILDSENSENNSISRFKWNSDNLDFFDLFYNSKFVSIEATIKHIKKKIYFRDIYLFINRVEKFYVIKEVILIRENL